MTLNLNKRNLKIIRLYAISLVCIFCYFLMAHYNVILVLTEKWGKAPDSEFTILLFTGLIQYGFLAVGICIFLMLTFLLIKGIIKND